MGTTNSPPIVTGFAFYTVGALDPRTVADAVTTWLGDRPATAVTTITTAPDADGETLHSVEHRWADYAKDPRTPNLIFYADTTSHAIDGGFDDGSVTGLPLIHLALSEPEPLPPERVLEIIDTVWREFRPAYGIVYPARTTFNVYSYAYVNGATVYPEWDNPFLFADDSPLYGGPSDHAGRCLRLVYPYSLLNADHLAIDVAGMPLREWIAAGPDRGQIVETPSGATVWQVAGDRIEDVTRTLGEAGVLLSWSPRGPRRRVPLP